MGGRNRSRAGRALRNVVVRLLDDDERVLRRLENVEPRDVGIPMGVLAELWFGAEKSSRKDANRARIEHLTSRVIVLGPAVARRYGECALKDGAIKDLIVEDWLES